MIAGIVLVELCSPHLVLTHVRRDDGLALGERVELINDLLHAQAALFGVFERELLLVAVEVGQPVLRGQFFDVWKQVAERSLGVAFDCDVHFDHLVELGGVDVDVDDARMGGEFRKLARGAIVETGADRDQQIASLHRFVGGARGTAELERLVTGGKAAVAFSLFPVGVSDLMAVSDAGAIMPPKSTWFEPKLADGLVSLVLD